MQTSIKPEVKLKIVGFDNSNSQVKEKSNYSKSGLDFKFYQKLFVILFASCALLIFPEAPQDSEALCKKYNPIETSKVW